MNREELHILTFRLMRLSNKLNLYVAMSATVDIGRVRELSSEIAEYTDMIEVYTETFD